MTRNVICRLGIGITLTMVGATMLSPIAGCQSVGLGDAMSSRSAMEMLSPMLKDAANSYVSNLTSLTSSLGNLNDLQGVLDFVKKVEPMVKELSSSYQALSSTTGEERSNLMKAFGPKLDSANTGFLDQSNAVMSDGAWAKVLSPVLDKVKLFQ